MAKTEMIGVWVTPDQKEKLEARAKALGMNVPEYLRYLATQDLEKQ